MALLKSGNANTSSTSGKGAVSLIAQGLKITGNLHSEGNIRIDGEFVGNLFVLSKLVVGKTGKIKGNVLAKEILIEGTVEGNILAKQLLELLPSANIKGNILATKLKVESGSVINGQCRMGKQATEKIQNFKFPDWEKLTIPHIDQKSPTAQEILKLFEK